MMNWSLSSSQGQELGRDKEYYTSVEISFSLLRDHRVVTPGQISGLQDELLQMSPAQRARVRDECRELLEAMLHD
jgi:hypothetical protein